MTWPGPEFDDINMEDEVPDWDKYSTPLHHKNKAIKGSNEATKQHDIREVNADARSVTAAAQEHRGVTQKEYLDEFRKLW